MGVFTLQHHNLIIEVFEINIIQIEESELLTFSTSFLQVLIKFILLKNAFVLFQQERLHVPFSNTSSHRHVINSVTQNSFVMYKILSKVSEMTESSEGYK